MSYYAVIPANILHSDISHRDKIIYAEIAMTADDDGICTKNNIHFSKTFGIAKNTVSASLTALRERGYIQILIEKGEFSGKFLKRYISIKPLPKNEGGGKGKNAEAMHKFQGGVSGNSAISLEGGKKKPVPKNEELCYYKDNNIIYTYIKESSNLNKNITKEQLAYLQKIVYEFYQSKHSLYPKLIKSNWQKDEKLIHDSINILYDLITIDKFTEIEVRDVIRFSLMDKFWSKNLMSITALRKRSQNGQTKFENIYMKWQS